MVERALAQQQDEMTFTFPDAVDEVVDVRTAGFRALRGYRHNETSSARMRAWVANGVARAWSDGELYGWRTDAGHRGHLYWWRDEVGWHGSPIQTIVLDWRPGDVVAEQHARRHLERSLEAFGPDSEIMLLPHQQSAVSWCLEHGFTVDAHLLLGHVRTARDRLVGVCNPPTTLEGLEIRRATPDDANPILELKVDVFTADRRPCWFGADPHYLEQVVRPMLDGREEALIYGIWKGRTLVGMFGALLERDNPYWGSVGGMDFTFRPEIQGQGIIKAAYRVLLEALVEHDIELFKGGTVQSAIRGLGELMGRWSIGTSLHRRTV